MSANENGNVSMDALRLKSMIIESLERQGFVRDDRQFYLPDDLDKEKIRALHFESTRHKIELRKRGLIKREPSLLKRIASGAEIVPEKIHPELVKVRSGSKDERLFRYATLHWSIPVSSGYGRRIRFLVFDRNTEKLMGLFGLCDPVFSLRNRDQWIGWNHEGRKERLHHVVDAFALGAVPPYSYLLCGKLIALLATSNEVRDAFRCQYEGRASVIRRRSLPGQIALVTTISALGRSSLYNRLKFRERLAFELVGYTQGFGEFQFSNGIYDALTEFVKANSSATAKHNSWGGGFRNRQEVVQKALKELGLPKEWRNHGIKREIYVAPLADNARAFLRGEDGDLCYYDQSVKELFGWFRDRWLLPRSERDKRYKDWQPQEWALWQGGRK